ncbi:MAG: hypothetical protein ABI540_07550 [Spartobacteria bacterium]
MIRRRVIENFKNQQWTAVVIELVIVVLGVFIGLQASNWNQERASTGQAANFAERLKADLREEDWCYQLQIAYNRQVLENASRAASALEGNVTMSDEALLINAYRATQYKQRPRRRSTYDELISTGTIGLIRDRALRDTAMRLYNSPTLENMAREGMQSRYREAFRMSLPNDVQRALAKNCGDRYVETGDYNAITGILDYPCTTGLSEQSIYESVKALRSTQNLLALLRLRIADIETRLVDLTSNNRDIMDHLRVIAGESSR